MTRDTDPSGWWGSVMTVVEATLVVAVVFGLPIGPEQKAALLGLFAALGPLVTQLFIRRDAYTPETVRNLVEDATNEGLLDE